MKQTKESDFKLYVNYMCQNCTNRKNEEDLCNIVSCAYYFRKEKYKIIKCVNYEKSTCKNLENIL